jgi:hypothetical protein
MQGKGLGTVLLCQLAEERPDLIADQARALFD